MKNANLTILIPISSFYNTNLIGESEDHLGEELRVGLEHVGGVALHVLPQEEWRHVRRRGRRVDTQQLTGQH